MILTVKIWPMRIFPTVATTKLFNVYYMKSTIKKLVHVVSVLMEERSSSNNLLDEIVKQEKELSYRENRILFLSEKVSKLNVKIAYLEKMKDQKSRQIRSKQYVIVDFSKRIVQEKCFQNKREAEFLAKKYNRDREFSFEAIKINLNLSKS